MRTILILSILLGLGTGAIAAALGVDGTPQKITCSIHSSPGSTTLSLRDESGSSFSRPVMRLIALPPDVAEARVRLQGGEDDAEPTFEVTAGRLMVMRGLRLLPVTISPKVDALGKTPASLPRAIDVDVFYDEAGGEAGPSSALTHSRGFFEPFTGIIDQDQTRKQDAVDEGTYLIVTDPQFRDAIEPLAAWKREKGLDVQIVTTDETGFTNTGIRNYISNLYHSSPTPPQYVLLVGDAPNSSFLGGIPTWDIYQATSDHPYAMVDGDDFLPDLCVGRLSARTVTDVQTQVVKIISYERTPEAGGSDWFTRALMVAGNYGSQTPVPVIQWCRTHLLNMGYTSADEVYYPPWWTDHLNLIPTSINRGVSLVMYRGWAYGIDGWEPPHFTSPDIASLANGDSVGWRLPVVMSFVCETCDFSFAGGRDCFGEYWLRAGNPRAPKGAVAFIGNTEHWSHTRFNDVAAIATMNVLEGGARQLGPILNAFKADWMLQFPDEMYFSGEGKESVEFYYYIYTLLGDPDMSIWMAPPTPITVSFPDPIPVGSNFIDVSVTRTADGTPVEGARIGVTQGENLLGRGWTDASGVARILASFESMGDSVAVVVTGAGVSPRRGTATVQAGAFLSLDSTAIDDDALGGSAGNGDGIANPHETIELTPTLRNRDAATATNVQATLASLSGDSVIVSGQVSFPDIPPGGTSPSTAPFVIRVPSDAPEGMALRLRIDAATATHHSVSEMRLTVRAADLRHDATAVDGDGVLAPGETAGLSVILRNAGSLASSPATTATLHSRSPELITLSDSVATYSAIQPAGTGGADHAFTIHANPEAGIGQVANFTLSLRSSDGQISTTSFGLAIGAADHSAPLGPDSYGYYAYDNTDTDYPDTAPTFDYVTCSPAYGGNGHSVPLADNSIQTVALPFSFVYYGQSYNQIAVSDNGWIAFDTSTYFDFYNWHMPSTYGSGAKVAPFWDNLDPIMVGRTESLRGDSVYVYSDTERHRFVVEWSRLPNYNSRFDDLQTFEVILYDPAFYPTDAGDGNGIIDFQYKQIINNDQDRMYATVGIENQSKDVGLEYTYANLYPAASAPLGAGLAIRFTTERPRYSPFTLDRVAAEPLARSVRLSWQPADDRPRGGYRIYRGTIGGSYRLLTERALGAEERQFLDDTANPDSSYSYKIGSTDPFGRETVLGPFSYVGREATIKIALEARTPNPFRGSLDLMYAVPRKGLTTVRIHDLTGRLLRTLVEGDVEAGVRSITWNGKDEQGRDMPSGIYLCKLRTGKEQRSLKLTLLR